MTEFDPDTDEARANDGDVYGTDRSTPSNLRMEISDGKP